MRNYIAKSLAALGSAEMQERAIANATKEGYLVPEEILDDAWAVVEAVRDQVPWTRALSSEQVEAVLDLGEALDREEDALARDLKEMSPATLVFRSASWKAVRQAAHRCMERLGCNEVGSNLGIHTTVPKGHRV